MAEWRKHVSKLRAIPPASCFWKARGPAEHPRCPRQRPLRPCRRRRCPTLKWPPLLPLPSTRPEGRTAAAVLSCRWRRSRSRSCGCLLRPWGQPFSSSVVRVRRTSIWSVRKLWVLCELFLILVESCFNGKERQVVAVIFFFFLNPQTKKKLAGVTSKLQRSTSLRRNKAPESHCILILLVYSQLTSLKIAGGLYLNLWYRIE